MRFRASLTFWMIVYYLPDLIQAHVNYKDFFNEEDLKAEIWKSIHQHTAVYNAYESKAEQERKFEEIYATIKSTYRGHDLFVQDVLIRRLATLKYGDNCFAPKQQIVDFTGSTSTPNQTERTIQIISYQEAILRTSYPICDYRLNLQCSSLTSKCVCKMGKIYEAQVDFTKVDRCELLAGQNCGPDYDDGTYFYDAMENFYYWTKSKALECSANSTCRPEQFFFHNKCWCERGKICKTTVGKLDKDIRMIIERNQVIASNFIINIDQNCDPNFQNNLLNPSLGERTRTSDRLARLHMLSDYDVTFCNLELFLNCTEDSKKCDCWDPLTFEKGHCRIKNKIPCGESFSQHLKFYTDGLSIGSVGKMLQMNFQPSCIELAGCSKSSNGLHQCTCTEDDKAGPFCNETKSNMMKAFLENQRVWPFPKDYAHTELVHEFNRNFQSIEERMTLSYDDRCYLKNSKYFIRLMKFLQTHSAPEKVKNIDEYKRALHWTKILVDTEILFCHGFQGLSCSSSSRRCRCMDGFHWDFQSSECRINAGRSCHFQFLSTLFTFKCGTHAVCNMITQTCECPSGFRGYQCDQISMLKSRVMGSNFQTENIPKPLKLDGLESNSTETNIMLINSNTTTKLRWFEKILGQKYDQKDSDANAEIKNPRGISFSNSLDEIPIELQQDCPDGANHSCRQHYAIARNPKGNLWFNSSSDRAARNPIKDFDKLDKSILDTMTLPLDATCDPTYDKADYTARYFNPEFYSDEDLIEYFPLIQLHFEKSPKIQQSRCNGFKYLSCDPITRTCKCNVTFDLLPQNGSCYIRSFDLCGDTNTLGVVVGKKRNPPNCLPVDVCDRIRFNLHRCRPLLVDEVFNTSAVMIPSTFLVILSLLQKITHLLYHFFPGFKKI